MTYGNLHNRHLYPRLTGSTIAQWLERGFLSQADVGLKLSLILPGCEPLETYVPICKMGIIIPNSQIHCKDFRS